MTPTQRNRPLRLLLLTGIEEELWDIIRICSLQFEKRLGCYRSSLYPFLYAATLGAGISKAGKTERLILRSRPDVIINAGLVGILSQSSAVEIGERLPVGKVAYAAAYANSAGVIWSDSHSSHNSHNSHKGAPSSKGADSKGASSKGGDSCYLVSVKEPIFSPKKKSELMQESGANICDMEAAPLLTLLGEWTKRHSLSASLIFCKVAGDRPEHHSLFRHEEMLRGWHRSKSLRAKLTLLQRLLPAPFALLRLLALKKRALKALSEHTSSLLHLLIKRQLLPPHIDSIFYPL